MRIQQLLAAVLLLSATVLRAQDWRTEQIADVGLEIDVPGRLERLPMQLGQEAIYHRARLRPKDDKDYVRGQYTWYCDLYEFSKKDPKPDELPAGLPPEIAKQLQEMIEQGSIKRYKAFKDWLDDKEQSKLTFVAEGKAKKGRAGKMDYVHWVWRENMEYGPCGIVYCEAAVFSFPDKEVALVIEMPLETEKPGVPKSKWKTLIDRMIASGKKLDPADLADDGDKKKDQYANTPERQQALADAKKNVQGLPGWDYFTQPNYIVLYSWDFEKPDERSKARKEAVFYAARLEKMRELYQQNYALDETGLQAVMPDPNTIPSVTAPVTGAPKPPAAEGTEPEPDAPPDGEEQDPEPEQQPSKPYSVFRLCATYDQFQKYGQSPPGVVGWFSPQSKELVVFLGGDKMMGPGATETVTYHEGWHQYADHYFHPPGQKKHASLHRWFDEGQGDYFGSFRFSQTGWKYIGSKMRFEDCKQMVRVGDYVPFRDIVRWDRRRFYSGRAAYYYAQAYSMVDFFRRGEKTSKDWKPRYGEILDMYRKVVLVTGDSSLAVDTAFREFKDDDWKQLEAAWKAWVSGPQFLSGK